MFKRVEITVDDRLKKFKYFSSLRKGKLSIPDKPYIKEILEFQDLSDLEIEELEKAILTCRFFGVDSSYLVKSLIWQAGTVKGVFEKYFTNTSKLEAKLADINFKRYAFQDAKNLKQRLKDSGRTFIINKKLSSELSDEIRKVIVEPCCKEELSVRFTPPNIFKAVLHGNLQLLQHIVKQDNLFYKTERGKKKSYVPLLAREGLELFYIAVVEGYLDCVEYLQDNCSTTNENAIYIAAKSGHLDVLEFLHTKKYSSSTKAIEAASEFGHLKCLEFLIKNNYPFTKDATLAAARGSQVKCLKFLYKNKCPLHEDCPSEAMRKGKEHLDILEFLYKSKKKLNWDDAVIFSCEKGDVKSLEISHRAGGKLVPLCMTKSISNIQDSEHLECLKYLRHNKCSCPKGLSTLAASKENLECLKYLRKEGYVWDSDAAAKAARAGNIKCLTYLCDNGANIDENTFVEAVYGANPRCVEYLYEKRCRWDERATTKAIEMNLLGILKFLHKKGCPIDKEVKSSFPSIQAYLDKIKEEEPLELEDVISDEELSGIRTRSRGGSSSEGEDEEVKIPRFHPENFIEYSSEDSPRYSEEDSPRKKLHFKLFSKRYFSPSPSSPSSSEREESPSSLREDSPKRFSLKRISEEN